MSEMPRNMRLMSTMVGPSATTRANMTQRGGKEKRWKGGPNLCRWQPTVGCDDRSEPVLKSCQEFAFPFHESWLSCWVHSAVGLSCKRKWNPKWKIALVENVVNWTHSDVGKKQVVRRATNANAVVVVIVQLLDEKRKKEWNKSSSFQLAPYSESLKTFSSHQTVGEK